MKKYIYFFSCVIIFTCGIVLMVATYRNHSLMQLLFTRASYYIIAATVGIWAYVSLRVAATNRESLKTVLKADRYGFVFSLVLSIVLVGSVTPSFRILTDQTNVIAVSKSMTFEKTVNNTTEGYWYYGNYWPVCQQNEERPFLLSFLVHLVHVLSGYRPENGFVVNFFCLAALFSILFVFVKKYLGDPWGYIAIILVSSQPLVSQSAASVGLELIQTLFFFITLISLAWYLKKPSSEKLLFLWVQLLMYINTRYECILPVFVLTLLLLFLKKLCYHDLKDNLLFYSFTPILMLSMYCQRLLLTDTMWQQADERPASTPVFAFEHVTRHSAVFFKKAFELYSDIPYAGIVNVAGVLGLTYFAFNLFSKKICTEKSSRQFVFCSSIIVLVMWIFLTSYYYANMESPSSSRFFLPFVCILSLSATYFISCIKVFNKPFIAILLSFACFVFYHPISTENRFSNSFYIVNEYNFAMDFFKRQPDKNFLIIYDRPRIFTVNNFGAISFDRANKDPENNHLLFFRRHLFREIFVIQRFNNDGKEPLKGFYLDPAYHLKPVAELQLWGQGYVRISKVIMDFKEGYADQSDGGVTTLIQKAVSA